MFEVLLFIINSHKCLKSSRHKLKVRGNSLVGICGRFISPRARLESGKCCLEIDVGDSDYIYDVFLMRS